MHVGKPIFAWNVGQVFLVNLTFQAVILFRPYAVCNRRIAYWREQEQEQEQNTTKIYSHWKPDDKLRWQLYAHYAEDLQGDSGVSLSLYVKLNLDFPFIRIKR
jgi:hypothetical protein